MGKYYHMSFQPLRGLAFPFVPLVQIEKVKSSVNYWGLGVVLKEFIVSFVMWNMYNSSSLLEMGEKFILNHKYILKSTTCWGKCTFIFPFSLKRFKVLQVLRSLKWISICVYIVVWNVIDIVGFCFQCSVCWTTLWRRREWCR